MTTVSPSCEHCGAPVMPHCKGELCVWQRCMRCHSYGKPGIAWRNYDKGAAFNLMTMNDVTTINPNDLPATRRAIAGYTD